MSQVKGMCIGQFGSTTVALILREPIKDLLTDVVSIGGDFFFFYRQLHNSISLVLDHGKCFVSLLSTQSPIVGTTLLGSVL